MTGHTRTSWHGLFLPFYCNVNCNVWAFMSALEKKGGEKINIVIINSPGQRTSHSEIIQMNKTEWGINSRERDDWNTTRTIYRCVCSHSSSQLKRLGSTNREWGNKLLVVVFQVYNIYMERQTDRQTETESKREREIYIARYIWTIRFIVLSITESVYHTVNLTPSFILWMCYLPFQLKLKWVRKSLQVHAELHQRGSGEGKEGSGPKQGTLLWTLSYLSELLPFYSLSTLRQTHKRHASVNPIFLNCCRFTAFPVPLFITHTHVQTFCGPPLVFLNCCFTAFPLFNRHTRVQTPTLQPQSSQILRFLPTLFKSETTCPPMSGTTMLLSLLSQT